MPRFLSDDQLREHFGLTKRALNQFRLLKGFPKKELITKKTDMKAVEMYFDKRSGLLSANTQLLATDGEENFG